MPDTLSAAVFARRAAIRRTLTRTLISASLLVAACSSGGGGGDKVTGPTKTVAGTYALQTIDATRPPVEVYHGPYFDGKRFYNQMVVLVQSGNVTLAADETWTLTLDAQITLDGQVTQQQIAAAGDYAIDGENITLTMDAQNRALPGTISKGTISLTMDMGDNKKFKAYAFRK